MGLLNRGFINGTTSAKEAFREKESRKECLARKTSIFRRTFFIAATSSLMLGASISAGFCLLRYYNERVHSVAMKVARDQVESQRRHQKLKEKYEHNVVLTTGENRCPASLEACLRHVVQIAGKDPTCALHYETLDNVVYYTTHPKTHSEQSLCNLCQRSPNAKGNGAEVQKEPKQEASEKEAK